MIMERSAYNFRHLVTGKISHKLTFISKLSSSLPMSFSVRHHRHHRANPYGDRTLVLHFFVVLVVELAPGL